jgi:8-oxo-dGTP diphosphatase
MSILTKEESKKLQKLDNIDWSNWKPVVRATLLFVLVGEKVLMIKKKTGLGIGKFNAAGGKIEEGETIEEAAIRELQEELCVTAFNPKMLGDLKFQFRDGYSLHTYVFVATEFEGTPTETREAIPVWFDKNALPFDNMWEDDLYWVPQLLDGEEVRGKFLFDGDEMVDYEVYSGLEESS